MQLAFHQLLTAGFLRVDEGTVMYAVGGARARASVGQQKRT